MKRLDIAVDFDGAIVKEEWPNIGKPRPFAFSVIRWMMQHHNLILNTCRSGQQLRHAKLFLYEHGFQFPYINENTPERIQKYGGDCRKIAADLYIDDRQPFYWNWPMIFFWILWLELKNKLLGM